MKLLRSVIPVLVLVWSSLSASGQTYVYDPAGRLTSAVYPAGQAVSYAYDPAGNMLSVDIMGGIQPGDMNGDGLVNAFDIDLFVLALVNPEDYTQQTGLAPQTAGDVNGDGEANAFDIDAFVVLLTGNVIGLQAAQLAERVDAARRAAPDYDSDGDAVPDALEALAGTDPSDSSDFFHIIRVARREAQIELEWSSVSGQTYVVEWSTTGQRDSWQLLEAGAIRARGAFTHHVAALAPENEGEAVFYRVRIVPE